MINRPRHVVESKPYLLIKLGRYRDNAGKTAIKNMHKNIEKRNGIIALNNLPIGKLAAVMAIYKPGPTGGVTNPIKVAKLITTPKWIGSIP